jgi:hypothetical protein
MVAMVTRFDFKMYQSALAFYGLPTSYNRVFKTHPMTDKDTGTPILGKDGKQVVTLRSCKAAQESMQGNAVWVQVNESFEGTATFTSQHGTAYPKKATNQEIAIIRNITLDFEYPPDPQIAHGVATKLVDYLAQIGIVEPGHPIEDSGAGAHIVMPIVPVETTPHDPLWNASVAHVVKQLVEPEFNRLCAEAGVAMDMEGFDVSRIISCPGTWRPTNPKKADCEALKAGYLRRWLAPYTNGNYPTRVENAKLSEMIREAYTELKAEVNLNVTRGEKQLEHNAVDSLSDISDNELIQRAMAAQNGSAFVELWYGGTSGYGDDWSSSDLALCNKLAFWTGRDASRMDTLFRQSALMRGKWDRAARTGETYGEGTIREAIASCSEVYDPGYYKREDRSKATMARTDSEDSSNETAGTFDEVKAQVMDAIERKDVDAIYNLADQIIMLSTPDQASIGSAIKRDQRKLDGYSQRDFNNCLKDAKIKREKREREERIKKVKERAEFRAFINIGDVASRDIRTECIQALVQANDPPSLFVQGNELCRVLHEKYKREDIDGKAREYSRSYIERHTDISLLNRLIDVADFGVIEEKGDDVAYKYKLPETRLASLVLEHNEKPYPHITGTTSVPILRPSGEISTTAGYDERSHLWYAPSDDLAALRIPESPTKEDALKAVEVIDDILHDFRFASKKDRTHTWAALLTTLLRPIVGNVPLCNIDAPMQGTGKSLLCMIIVMIATLGAYSNLIAPQSNPKYPAEAEEEWRKSILANLMQGYPIVVIDNLPRGCKFSCAALDSALTKPEFTGRILGQSRMMTVPSRAIWICNGNNITMAGDTARRTYHIRLDAQSSKPWLRKDFRYDNIISTVKEKRADIITALLTIIRAWFVAGRPPAENRIRMGSFEEWSDVLGGILEFIGLEDFLSDMEGLSDESNQADDEWVPFMEAWYERFPDKAHTQKELHAWFSGKIVYPGTQPMNELLPGGLRELAEEAKVKPEAEAKFKNTLQKVLKRMNDVCFGQKNVRLEIRYNKSLRQDTWKVCIPDVNPEPEHSGAFRSIFSEDHNTSGDSSGANSESFPGAPEHFLATHTKKNIFSSHGVDGKKNIFSPYISNEDSGSSGEVPLTPHVECDRSSLGHQNHVLRNAPESSDASGTHLNTNTTSIPEEHRDLLVEYQRKVFNNPVATLIWRAPDSGHKNTYFGKNEHIAHTKSLLQSGDVGKIKAALEAMKRTLGTWEG